LGNDDRRFPRAGLVRLSTTEKRPINVSPDHLARRVTEKTDFGRSFAVSLVDGLERNRVFETAVLMAGVASSGDDDLFGL
jgi:hypothetical protein